MTVNIENITKLINHLKKVDKANFDMSDWFKISVDNQFRDKPPGDLVTYMEKGKGDCGTAACIAGHAMLLKNSDTKSHLGSVNIRGGAEYAAATWLGIDEETAAELFRPGHFRNGKYVGHPIPKNIPLDVAIRVLEHLKATGEVDWGNISEYYTDQQRNMFFRYFGKKI